MQKGNTEEAIAAYQKVVDAGNAEACYRLAIWTAQQANGNLSEEEFKQVLSWLKQAAQQEHPEACYCMGALMEKNHRRLPANIMKLRQIGNIFLQC